MIASLVNGTQNEIGSVYRYPLVSPGVDALVTITDGEYSSLDAFDGGLGASVQNINMESGFFEFDVVLVVAGTTTRIAPVDLILNSFDIDGGNANPGAQNKRSCCVFSF